MKITISQTRQIRQYEPLKIEIMIDTEEEGIKRENWQEVTEEMKQKIDELLYPEKYKKQEKKEEKKEEVTELDHYPF